MVLLAGTVHGHRIGTKVNRHRCIFFLSGTKASKPETREREIRLRERDRAPKAPS